MRRLLSIPGITVAIFFGWKVALLLLTSHPIPSNDSFFYDGPVVNYVLHGEYCNPSLAQVLPISGTQVFSAYPPFYQAVLLGWMKCFGTSELAAMWFHLVLLAIFALTMLKIFRTLNLPPLVSNCAALFLFGITFHDRPDTLAHVLGALTVLAVVRGLMWSGAALLLLTFCTSLQIGGIYFLWTSGLIGLGVWMGRLKFPWAAISAFVLTITALVALVKFKHPLFWAGFLEHVQVTPSFTGLRMPRADDLLKVIRTATGIGLAIVGFIWLVAKSDLRTRLKQNPELAVGLAGALAALALIGGCLFVLTPNTIHIAGYLQPVVVGCFLAAFVKSSSLSFVPRVAVGGVVLGALLLVSVRAVGMSTWGILCARDVSRTEALREVNRALDLVSPGDTVFVSAAYLYESARRTNVNSIHSDWPAQPDGVDPEKTAIERLRPAALLLTQFDYYRRYEAVVAQFRRERGDVEVEIDNQARVQSPDAIPATRRIVQHIAWAPVIIEFKWPTQDATSAGEALQNENH